MELVEGGDTQIVSAGEVFWESGAIMTADNVTEVPMELVAFQFLPVE